MRSVPLAAPADEPEPRDTQGRCTCPLNCEDPGDFCDNCRAEYNDYLDHMFTAAWIEDLAGVARNDETGRPEWWTDALAAYPVG